MNNHIRQKVTLKSIAGELGVSFSTVSKSLNGHPGVKDETRRLVHDKARELGYAPNLLARGLRTQSINTVAIIFNDIENPVLTYIFKTISVEMAKLGYTTLICDAQFDADTERSIIESVISRMPDYVIIAPAVTGGEGLRTLAANNASVIAFDTATPALGCHFVDVDYEYGGYLSACELLAKGHRDILIITEPPDYPYSARYVAGIRRAFAEYAVPFREESLRFAHSSMESACSIVLSLWDRGERRFSVPFTAAVCFGDNFALGVYKAAAQLGLRVPDDISVVGFDNNEICDFSAPPLTSVHLPRERMARSCLEILRADLLGQQQSHHVFSLTPHLVARDSVKPLRP